MTTETQALIVPDQNAVPEFSAFGSASQFADAQRMAKCLCSSTIVPDNYRGEANLGNCVIALEIAKRIDAGVLAVMQNLYIVHGKPAWSSQFLISCANASRKFTPLRYRMTGQPGTDTWGCVCWAQDKTGETLESPEVTIATAKAEGWYQKNGSKWRTMPELMLRYRTATLFVRLYAPELTMGIRTDDEVIDIDAIATPAAEPSFTPAVVVVEPQQPVPQPKPKKRVMDAGRPVEPLTRPETPLTATPAIGTDDLSFENAAPVEPEAAQPSPVPEKPAAAQAAAQPVASGDLDSILGRLIDEGVPEEKAMIYLRRVKIADATNRGIADIDPKKWPKILKAWESIIDNARKE